MKITSLLPSFAAVLLLTAAVIAAATAAQAPQASAQQTSPQGAQPAQGAPQGPPQGPPPQEVGPSGRPMRNFPRPTNLKVLPKDLTGAQVRKIMEKWAASLGVHCEFCHVPDTNHAGSNGRPRLNFPDDSKPDKQIARIMYSMTQQMNTDYISKAMDLDKDDMGSPVTCGTCHRGHKMPEDFVIPQEEHEGGPGGGEGGLPQGGTMPQGGTAPPAN